MAITSDAAGFVSTVLAYIPEPYPEDITLLVFQKIENTPALLDQYYRLASKYSQSAINPAIGKEVKRQTGTIVAGRGNAYGTSLISSYTKLKPMPNTNSGCIFSTIGSFILLILTFIALNNL